MFVHAGASLHGHELSSPKRDTSPAKGNSNHHQQPRNRLLRSALRPLGDANNTTSSPNNHSKHARFSLSLSSPSDLPSGRRSFTDPVLSPSPSPLPSSPTSPLTLSQASPSLPRQRRPASDIVSKKDLAVRFREPTSTMASRASVADANAAFHSDDESLAGSDITDYTIDSSTRSRRRKTSPRNPTRYAFAHPAPQRKTKQRNLIHFRPRMLLQLQRLESRRPIPAFDVLPSSTVSTSFLHPRLSRHFPRLRTKPELGSNDLVVVKSEDYKSALPAHSDHGKLENRDLMGVVSPLPEFGEDAAEIIMGDGSVWSTTLRGDGSYEFNCIDSHGIARTARWAKRPIVPGRRASDIPPSPASTSPEYRWTFSIIDPLTKRHPIMGVLTAQELVTYDTYSSVSSSWGRFPPTKPFSNLAAQGDSLVIQPSTPTKPERTTHDVPEEYKELMIVTASWISMRLKGWPDLSSPKPRRNSTQPRKASTTSSVAERRRTFPFSSTSDHLSPQLSPRPSFGTPRASDERPRARAQDSFQPEPPIRHMSTGAAYMRRRIETGSVDDGRAMKENVRTEKEEIPPPVIRTQGSGSEEERTVTCRIKVKRLTQKLFHRNGHRKAALARC